MPYKKKSTKVSQKKRARDEEGVEHQPSKKKSKVIHPVSNNFKESEVHLSSVKAVDTMNNFDNCNPATISSSPPSISNEPIEMAISCKSISTQTSTPRRGSMDKEQLTISLDVSLKASELVDKMMQLVDDDDSNDAESNSLTKTDASVENTTPSTCASSLPTATDASPTPLPGTTEQVSSNDIQQHSDGKDITDQEKSLESVTKCESHKEFNESRCSLNKKLPKETCQLSHENLFHLEDDISYSNRDSQKQEDLQGTIEKPLKIVEELYIQKPIDNKLRQTPRQEISVDSLPKSPVMAKRVTRSIDVLTTGLEMNQNDAENHLKINSKQITTKRKYKKVDSTKVTTKRKYVRKSDQIKVSTPSDVDEQVGDFPSVCPPSKYPSLGEGPPRPPFTGKMYMGAHISAAGGIHNVFPNARAIKAKSFAMFLRSQRQWHAKPYQDEHVKLYKELRQGFPGHLILPHGSYLMNLGSIKPDLLEKSRKLLVEELQRCNELDIPHFNFHPGSCVGGTGREDCCRTIAESINLAHSAVPNVIVVLENMCRQGNTIGGDFHELRLIIEGVEDKRRVGVCLDTCHAHNAGYDLSTEAGFNLMISDFEMIIGFQFLRGLHINDSKNEAGAHVDRHENIGKGHLGLEGMRRIMNCPHFVDLPLILETPYTTDEGYAKEIRMLEALVEDHDKSAANGKVKTAQQDREETQQSAVNKTNNPRVKLETVSKVAAMDSVKKETEEELSSVEGEKNKSMQEELLVIKEKNNVKGKKPVSKVKGKKKK